MDILASHLLFCPDIVTNQFLETVSSTALATSEIH